MKTQNAFTHSIWRGVAAASALVLATALGAGCSKAKEDGANKTKPTTDKPTPDKPTPDKPTPDKPTTTAGAGSLADAAGTYEIDSGHSAIVFKVQHMGAGFVYGMFPKVTGTLTLDADPAKSAVELEVAPDSVFTADKKRDDHLKSPDFFNTAQFPKIAFKSKSVRAAGEGKYEVTGDLALHGVTKEVTATFDHTGVAPHPQDASKKLTGFHGTLSIKRSDYGMGNLIGPAADEIDLIISVEGAQK